MPLVVFTVLAQMAVGAFILLGAYLLGWTADYSCNFSSGCLFAFSALLTTGFVFGTGVLVSLLHLGRPLKAYQALLHQRTSWLSREILMVGIFGVSWMVFSSLLFTQPWYTDLMWVVYGFTALAGLALIFSMAKVYQVDSMPVWKNWKTNASFYLTAILLGLLFSMWLFTNDLIPKLALLMLFPSSSLLNSITFTAAAGLALLALDPALQGKQKYARGKAFWLALLRFALIVAAVLALAGVLRSAYTAENIRQVPDLLGLTFLLALGAQLIGRWQFYEKLNEREL
jgi:anaerobic dimethyl sulfoxide reductase subunit C (anchor subunit)